MVVDTNYTADTIYIDYYNADGDLSYWENATHCVGYNGMGKGDYVHKIEVYAKHEDDFLGGIELQFEGGIWKTKTSEMLLS